MSIEFRENSGPVEKLIVLNGFYTAKEWGENVDSEARDEYIGQYLTIKQKEWAVRGINTYRRREGWKELQIDLEEE